MTCRLIGRKLYGPLPEWEPTPQGLCRECLRRDVSTLEDVDGTVLLYICDNCGYEWEPSFASMITEEFKTVAPFIVGVSLSDV